MTEKSIAIVCPTKKESNPELWWLINILGPQLKNKDSVLFIDASHQSRACLMERLDKQEWQKKVNFLPDPGTGVAGAKNIGTQAAIDHGSDIVFFMDADGSPADGTLDALRAKVKPDTIVQGSSVQLMTSPLSFQHALWRRSVTNANARDNGPHSVANTRCLGLDLKTLESILGAEPFLIPNIKKHGGCDAQIAKHLVEAGLKFVHEPHVLVFNNGDTGNLIELLRSKYAHARGRAITDVLPRDTFSHKNFERAVLQPMIEGVNSKIALMFWAFYLLGASAGLSQKKYMS